MARNEDLRRARSSLAEAELARRPSDRYLAAHIAALRVVAFVFTHRAPPHQKFDNPANCLNA